MRPGEAVHLNEKRDRNSNLFQGKTVTVMPAVRTGKNMQGITEGFEGKKNLSRKNLFS
jgi:hypothetical protein